MADIDDIIQPTCNNRSGHKDCEDELFTIPIEITMARDRDEIYQEYCRYPQEM